MHIAQKDLFRQLEVVVGKSHLLKSPRKIAPYVKGFREGQGKAIAVVKPQSLLDLWQTLEILVPANIAIIMQAANTGLTGGSTPHEACDRDAVIISTLALDDIHLLESHNQFIAFPGASLFKLEKTLDPLGRVPHSVIGSSCIGASIVGGVCNNSGGALVERGPAYTELSLYARVDEYGELQLVNDLDVDLGETPVEILTNLQRRQYQAHDIKVTSKQASDSEYKSWVRDTQSERPARYNADKRRLHAASGCAGKLVVFAVRLDSFVKPDHKQTFVISTDSTQSLNALRVAILESMTELPISAEYMHRDVIELTDEYGRDTMLVLKYFGTEVMPRFFNYKKSLERFCRALPLMQENTIDWLSNRLAKCFPSQVSKQIKELKTRYEHHLLLSIKGQSVNELKAILAQMNNSASLHVLECDENEAKQAYLLRFAAAGAAIQYQKLNHRRSAGLLALDIALPRNCSEWYEQLPMTLKQKISHHFYYGHYLCHVFHQDYIVKAGYDPIQVKAELLSFIDTRGAEYPAEHNVGHLYVAKPDLAMNYKQLDPTNTFNPGIGKMSKSRFYQ
ncbi:D-lactate dehydrogenase [Pseudoalteromonas xiamenensis]|uniref:D-lactate dehydrogenase n=1 Tax=Pseudoalteromonas xiamenensis TaxID=882626 RepID=UPI0035E51DF4